MPATDTVPPAPGTSGDSHLYLNCTPERIPVAWGLANPKIGEREAADESFAGKKKNRVWGNSADPPSPASTPESPDASSPSPSPAPSPSPSPPEYGTTGSLEHPTTDPSSPTTMRTPSSSADVPLACDISGLTPSPWHEAREPYSRGIRFPVNRTRNQIPWQRPPPRTARAPHSRVSVGALFGAGKPIAKSLLDSVRPCLLPGVLYLGSGSGLGSGLGLGLFRLIRRSPRVRILRSEMLPLAGAVGLGGILGPVVLMFGVLEWRPSSREPSRWCSDSLVMG